MSLKEWENTLMLTTKAFFKTHPDPNDRIENIKDKIPSVNLDQTLFNKRLQRFNSFVKS